MRSHVAITREYRKAERLIKSRTIGGSLGNQSELRGARQALAWVLEDNAMAPVKSSGVPIPKRKKVRR